MKEDIDLLCDLGIWGANISFPIGDLQRKYKLKISDEQYMSRCLDITRLRKKQGTACELQPL
jgi:isopropylmalate/homocitrate/citramalate synthase